MSAALISRIVEVIGAVRARTLTAFSPDQEKNIKNIIKDIAGGSKSAETKLIKEFSKACIENKTNLAEIKASATNVLTLNPAVEKNLAKAIAEAPTPTTATPSLVSSQGGRQEDVED